MKTPFIVGDAVASVVRGSIVASRRRRTGLRSRPVFQLILSHNVRVVVSDCFFPSASQIRSDSPPIDLVLPKSAMAAPLGNRWTQSAAISRHVRWQVMHDVEYY